MKPVITYKPYSKEDRQMIIQLYDEGHTTKEIAYVMNRSTRAIAQFIYMERKKAKNSSEKVSPVKQAPATKPAENPQAKEVIHTPPVAQKTREMEPREMIKKLYDMGYRIENNHLVCYQKVVVKVNDIINGQ